MRLYSLIRKIPHSGMQSLTFFLRKMFPSGDDDENILLFMRIKPGENDSTEFITAVNEVVEGLLQTSTPPSLIVIQIDNWFGPKWLGFAGKVMPGVAELNRDLRIPPFVPNRVMSQCRFAGPGYEEIDPGESVHQRLSSKVARSRKASEVAPGAALIWYSGNSKSTSRGSLMAYLSDARLENAWYADRSDQGSWHVTKAVGTEQDALKLNGVRFRGPRIVPTFQ